MANEPEKSSHFTDYLAHVLFIIAQSYCGAFLILLLGPLIRFLWGSDLTVYLLLWSFPAFWALVPKELGELVVAAAVAYPVGLVAAEFFYRVGQFLHLHNDLNLDDDAKEATDLQQIAMFRQKCRIQEFPSYSRIWEWENFQSAVFFYAEWVSLTFTALYSVCLGITVLNARSGSGSTRLWILASSLWAFSLAFSFVMRLARIGKYNSFRLANRAIKGLLDEKGSTLTGDGGPTK
jgi:hypothetical protein